MSCLPTTKTAVAYSIRSTSASKRDGGLFSGWFITDRVSLITDNELEIGSEHERDAFGRFITSKLPYPYVDNLDYLSPILRQQLEDASALAKKKKAFKRSDG